MTGRRLKHLVLFLSMLTICASVQAHKSSDAYVKLRLEQHQAHLRVDIALRDLSNAIELDGNDDQNITYAEVKAAWPAIETMVLAGVSVEGCSLKPVSQALERRNDGAYAALFLQGPCEANATGQLRYHLLKDIDPTHRAIAHLVSSNGSEVVRVINPVQVEEPKPLLSPSNFVLEGVNHIVDGYDHLLFLVCLLLPAVMTRRTGQWHAVQNWGPAFWPALGLVSAFTLAHSITLTMAAMRWLSPPSAWIEVAIAVTIMLTALDNLRAFLPQRRAWVAFVFGLIHGFGFANVLAELNLPTERFAWALLQFNVGIELGQLAVVSVLLGALFLLRQQKHYAGLVVRGGSIGAFVMGSFWLVQRSL